MTAPLDQAQKMDRMYRYTRHVYDLSRRYYLLGRDRLIDRLAKQPPQHILEVGCGTARNLIRLRQQAPQHMLYGLDASEEMLDTARRNLIGAGMAPAATPLVQGLAEDLDYRTLFHRAEPFDAVFFSYVLSMIPSAEDALDAALANVRPGGRVYIVDFWDQTEWPGWFARALRRWLALFDVHHRPSLHAYLHTLAEQGRVRLDVQPVARRYAYWATLTRLPDAPASPGPRFSHSASAPYGTHSQNGNGLVAVS